MAKRVEYVKPYEKDDNYYKVFIKGKGGKTFDFWTKKIPICYCPGCDNEIEKGRYCSLLCKEAHIHFIKTNSTKIQAYDHLGNKCKRCGVKKNLHFHHLDPRNKLFNISHRFCDPFELIKSEVDKCMLLCQKCHREVHLTNDPDYFEDQLSNTGENDIL